MSVPQSTGSVPSVAATVAAIHRHGVDEVHTALSDIERRYGPIDVVAAVDAWVAATLGTDGLADNSDPDAAAAILAVVDAALGVLL